MVNIGNKNILCLLITCIATNNIGNSFIVPLSEIEFEESNTAQQENISSAFNEILHIIDEQNVENAVAKKSKITIEQQNGRSLDVQPKKSWTFFVYMAADNDLRGFGARNLQQLAVLGSTLHINIVVELHTRISQNKKITRRYYIEKDTIIHLTNTDTADQALDSGSGQTLVSFCTWGIKNFPAEHYALILWNHGSGIVDPIHGRIINPSTLFNFNPITNKFELDRSIGFLDFISRTSDQLKERGICWDDHTGNYLNNQTLNAALNEICRSSLSGEKFDIIGFDACLMSMLEIANIVRQYAHIMVASQELELGAGWRYDNIIKPFIAKTLSPEKFARHIVKTYGENYEPKTDDYTLSAINLDKIKELENNISSVATLLIEALGAQKDKAVRNAIRASKNKLLCTHFDEPSYIDVHHLYVNLQANLKHFVFDGKEDKRMLMQTLDQLLTQGRSLMKDAVIANVVGKNLSQASGISIYFPENKIHGSYRKTIFAYTNSWIGLLTNYLAQ